VTTQEQQVRHLLVIHDQEGSRTVPLESSTYSIGRHSSNAIALNSRMVSRQHAMLLRLPDPSTGNHFFRLVDGDLLGKRSANGITVNSRRCFSHNLRHGDIIIFGGDVKATYHAVGNLSDIAFSKYTQAVEFTDLEKELSLDVSYEPIVPSDEELQQLSKAALIRLSSFPEMDPNPILEVNLAGQITYLNPAATRQFPGIRERAAEHPLLKNLQVLQPEGPRQLHVREVEIGDRIFEQFIHYIVESNLARCYLVDVTQRQQTEKALRESEERYAAAAKGANDGLWDWDLRTQSIYFSPRWKAMLGWDDQITETPQSWLGRIHPDDLLQVQAELDEHLTGLKPHFESEYRLLHQDGSYRWMRCRGLALRDSNHQPYRIAGSLMDITEYRQVQEQIRYDALHDAMTGLPNRTLMMDRLQQAINRAKRRPHYLFAVLFLDLDRFKVVNDSLGHLAGDQLLTGIADRLRFCLRAEDTVARIGGDEFAILVEDIQGVDYAIALAERIQQELSLPFNLDGHEVFTTASIGISLQAEDIQRPDDLLREADTAMYHAKSLGKARHEMFTPGMRVEAMALLQLETELRRAVEREEFLVYYQPIMHVNGEQPSGFEALIRWQHPLRGLVPPSEFIPIAEETGLIVPMSWLVLREACMQMQRWLKRFPASRNLTISVNITGKHFTRPDFLDNLQQILQETGLAPHRLKLEVTESVLMENTEAATTALNQLKSLGIQLYMDDFGTGYSSLSYLHRFPIDALKIDRCFINNLNTNESNQGIVRTIINLAQSLDLEVVAEGIETPEQLAHLKQLNCHYGQGYFFSRPMNSEAASTWLASYDLADEPTDALANNFAIAEVAV
jgi:diguanylate cyclase (GGDEF)-like protein/PAS domain S-box-containing protein